MYIYKYENIIVNTKNMTIEWKKGDRIVDPHMIKHFKALWRDRKKESEKEIPFSFKHFKALWRGKVSEKEAPFPFIVVNFELKLNTAEYQVR